MEKCPKYPKIQTIYRRDPANKYLTVLDGQFARPEFEYLARNEWTFTEKIDGVNVRVNWDCNPVSRITFNGRTDNAQIHSSLLAKLQKLFSVEKFARLYPEIPMILYGEGYGARIRKGGGNYIPDDVNFILFDVMIGGIWLERENVQDIANFLEIDTVPVVGRGTLLDAVEMAREGFQSRVGTQTAEGLVMRPTVELKDRRGRCVITKIKYGDFVAPPAHAAATRGWREAGDERRHCQIDEVDEYSTVDASAKLSGGKWCIGLWQRITDAVTTEIVGDEIEGSEVVHRRYNWLTKIVEKEEDGEGANG